LPFVGPMLSFIRRLTRPVATRLLIATQSPGCLCPAPE
jgi:hypothetical protein